MELVDLLEIKREEILQLAARHGAHNVRVFGSVARGEVTKDSDVDLLVDMEPECSLLDMVSLQVALRELLGRKVDVVTEASIYWLIRRRVLREARAL